MTRREHRGRRHDEPRTAVVPPVRVTEAEMQRLRDTAETEGVSVSDLVRSIPELHAVTTAVIERPVAEARRAARDLRAQWIEMGEAAALGVKTDAEVAAAFGATEQDVRAARAAVYRRPRKAR